MFNAIVVGLRAELDPHSEVHRHLDDALFEARQAGVTAERYEMRAHPADAPLDTADDAMADLMVVGCRGRDRRRVCGRSRRR